MPNSTIGSHGFTRRKFIAGAATLTAAGLLAGCAPQSGSLSSASASGSAASAGSSPDVLYAGSCRGNCGGGCFLNIHVRDGQVVRTSARDLPDTRYNRICARGATHVGRIYGANRIMYPMKRSGERGSGEFTRISWDEAIKSIAQEWKAITDAHGPEAMAMLNGTGNYALANGSSGFVTGMTANILGMSTITIDVDAAAIFGAQHAIGGTSLENELTDRENSKTIVLWGNNPTISLPQTMHFFLEARDAGTKFVVIDPIFNPNAARADWWIPVKPGTDGALALSVLNVLFDRGWVDLDLLAQKSNGAFLIKEDGTFLRMSDLGTAPTEVKDEATGAVTVVDPEVVIDGDKPVPFSEAKAPKIQGVTEVQGIAVHTAFEDMLASVAPYTPAYAASITGLTEDTIIELARVYHEDGPVATECMQGLNHYRNGHYTTWPVWLISLVTDNVGKPGAGIGMSEEYLVQIVGTNPMLTVPSDSKGNLCQLGGRSVKANTVKEIMETGQYAGQPMTIKGVYVNAGNPMCTMAEQSYTETWFADMDLVVVADICMTDTARYADYILPAAHWFETEDINYLFGTHPYLTFQEKAIEPVGEAKPDYDILQSIVKELGYGDFWTETAEEWMKKAFDSDVYKALGIDYDRIKSEQAVRMYAEPEFVRDTTAYATETGKYYMYREQPIMGYDIGQEVNAEIERHLHWEENVWMGEHTEYRAQHPFQMFSEHMRTHTHSQWSDCAYVKEYEPEPVVKLNPEDAAELGVTDGDVVRCYNTFGSVTMKAVISAAVPRKMAASGRSWNREDFIDGHFASLPSNDYNQCVANMCYNDCAVIIEKA